MMLCPCRLRKTAVYDAVTEEGREAVKPTYEMAFITKEGSLVIALDFF